jgi:hypothetical protein
MKKTVIAMAVATALPVTAQADATFSGSVEASYVIGSSKALDIDSDLDIAVEEVLSNGMTASASFDVGDEGDSGEASLKGDFGTLTVGSGLDKDGAYLSGVLVPTTELYEDTDTASTANAIHYSGSWAGLNIEAQINAGTSATGSTTRTEEWYEVTGGDGESEETALELDGDVVDLYIEDKQPAATQVAATYEFNGVTLGFASVDTDMTSDIPDQIIKEGTVISAAYSFGDLSVGYGDFSASDAVVMIGYASTYGQVDVAANFYDWGNDSTTTNGSASYTVDGLTVALNYDSDKGASRSKGIEAGSDTSTVTATYVSGDMTIEVGTEFDGSTDFSVALDWGNADLSLERDDSKSKTTAKYSVAF